MQRFIASDVLWEDFFKEPTKEELQRLSVTGVNVPDFGLPPEPRHRHDRVDEGRLAADPRRGYRRLHVQPARHRARLDDVLPAGQELSPDA